MSEQRIYIDPGNPVTNNMTGTNVVTGNPVLTRQAKKASWQNKWTGTPNGTFAYEGTNDRRAWLDPSSSEVVWTPLTISTVHGTAAPAGAASSNIVICTDLPYLIRCKYTNSSGSGALTSYLDMDRF